MTKIIAELTATQLLWLCILLHLVADFCLQGCLADLKQKIWWKAQIEKHIATSTEAYQNQEKTRERYRHDYIAGLVCHALIWSLLTYLPLMFVCTDGMFTLTILVNTFVHARVDDLKANRFRYNLWQDQAIHIIQIFLTLMCVL